MKVHKHLILLLLLNSLLLLSNKGVGQDFTFDQFYANRMRFNPAYAGSEFYNHGISLGKTAPQVVAAFIEMVPTDTVKYEVDKVTGYLRLDRPQKYSNVIPALYGFLPQTYCGDTVAALSRERLNNDDINGDGDPLDVCILTEKVITHEVFQGRKVGCHLCKVVVWKTCCNQAVINRWCRGYLYFLTIKIGIAIFPWPLPPFHFVLH